MLRWLKRRKRSAASVGILTAAALALGVMAFTYPGFTTTNVDMHDGGVWVTKTDESLLGHINKQAGELDAGLTVASTDFDVLQYDGVVLLKDNSNVALDAVDTGDAALTGQIPIPAGSEVTLRGGTVTILDPADGRLWAMPADALSQFSSEESQPLAELGQGATATADEEGGVHAASIEHGTLQSWAFGDEGFTIAQESEQSGLRDAAELSITAVGTTPAVLDAKAGKLILADATIDVPPNAALQQPGDESANLIIATPESLITQPLNGSQATVDDFATAGALAVPPVQVDGCVYALSTGDLTLSRTCGSQVLEEVVSEVDMGSVVFREHRGVVALNDVTSGVSWLVADELIMVDNWQDLIPPQSEEETDEEDDSSSEDVLDNRAPDESEENNDPVANDDTIFGARRGSSTLVPVTHNDTDPDGDLLTVSLVDEAPPGVRVSPVKNYTQFQVEVPADYGNSSLTFDYEVNDGRGGTDQATVTLQLKDETQNEAPEALREQSFEVEQRATYEHSVLDGWYDPDGDDVYLVDARSESGDTVQFSPNGRVNYTATGDVGPTELIVSVSDGTEVTDAIVKVTVRERGEGKPLANADYLAMGQDSRGSVRPMGNDFIPGGGKAWVASATARDGAALTVTLDRSTNTVIVESSSPGTYLVDYVLGAGPFSAQGTIRVDVMEPAEDAQPVAVRDLALLPVGGEALIDLTENDVDPMGGILVVQSVMADGARVSTQLINRNLLRIEDNRGLQEPVTIEYSVSNGPQEATGEIVIIPVAPPSNPRPPVAVDDTATLREGDYTSVDVTENDFSPDGMPFEVSPQIVETSLVTPDEGSVFVDGDKIRVHVVVDGPGTVDVTYEIVDEQGNRGTATLTVTVERRDAESNAPPVPKELTARVLAGSMIRIPIPLDGIDPEGDGVTLVGYDSNPEQGRIVNVGPDYFDYEAFDADGGTTVFEYRVRDRWGAESVSIITVGIAQPGAINQAPFAETDTVTVRPGRSVAVSVLENDTDPDGDNIVLTGVDAENADSAITGLQIPEGAETVNFTAPETAGEWQVRYSIEDVRGAPQTGTIRIVVAEDAPLVPPRAVDDVVDVTELTEGQPYDVDVRENDRDVDGDPEQLEVSVLTGPGTVAGANVQVVPAQSWQVVTYRVTDQDGGSSEAFVFVPGVGRQAPYLKPNTEYTIGSGEQLTIPLAEAIVMPQGGTPRITTRESVSATNDNGDDLVVDESTLAYTSEAGYVGKAAVTVEVTDGESAGAEDALTARISIPITVIPSSQVPPSFNGLAIQVEPGEDAVEYDLKPHTRDPDDGDVDQMEYSLGDGGVDGVHVEIRDQVFAASADPDVPAGTSVTYPITLIDPAGNEVPGAVQVQVVTSKRELAQAVADTAETEQGVPVSVPAITNDVNPFRDRGEPLEIVSVRVVSGEVESQPSTDGSSVDVTPGADFAGTLTLQYTVQDATKSQDREVTGRISVNVLGRPEPPPRPNVQTIGDSEVTLSWAAPAANGSPITGYLVESSAGEFPCASTTCTVTGLTNDTTYTFTVRAINDVGESDPSAPSNPARPDVKPEQPEAPTAVRGDQQLEVSWEEPENRGSPITAYVLQITPPDLNGESQVELPATTSHTWQNLQNGTEYRFSVQAVNNADEPSDFSPESAGRIPAGKPTAPTNVTANATLAPSKQSSITLTWGSSDGNGLPVDSYVITVLHGGSAVEGAGRTVPPSGSNTNSAAFENLAVSETPYTFEVHAVNDVGDSAAVGSNQVRSVRAPEAPTLTAGADGDREATVTITPGSTNGYRANEVQYSYSVDGGAWVAVAAGDTTITGLTNATHTVVARATAEVDGQTSSAESNSVNVRPYGPPPAPQVSASGTDTGVNFSWPAPVANGRPIEGVRYRTQVNGGAWSGWTNAPVNSAGSATRGASAGQTVAIQVEVQAPGGPATGTASGKVNNPTPVLTVIGGGQRSDSGQTGELLVLKYENLKPGQYGVVCMQMTNGQLQAFGQSATTPYVINTSSMSGTSGVNPDEIKCFSNNREGVALQLVSGPAVNDLGTLTSQVNTNWPP